MMLDHLGQATEARGSAFLVDRHGRAERRGRVVASGTQGCRPLRGRIGGADRDHQVERRLPGEPGMRRCILVQHHPDHRPPRPLPAVRTPPGRHRHRAALLQPQPGGGAAQPVAVPPPQHVVEMPDREPDTMLVTEPKHPLQLIHRRAARRRLADPAVGQPGRPLLRVPPAPAPERPLADAQRRCRLAVARPPRLPPLQQLLKAHDPDPRAHPRPTLPPQPAGTALEPDRPRAPYAGQLARSLQLRK